MRLVFSLISIFFLSKTYGQVIYGLKAGVNRTYVSINQTTFKGKFSFNGGGFAEADIADRLLIRPELLYSNKGSKLGNEKLDYITLPVLLGFRVTKKLNVFVGPEVGYLLAAKVVPDNIPSIRTSLYDRLEKAFNVGSAYKISRRWGAEIRYNYGFKGARYYLDADGRRIEALKVSNRVLQAGFYFNLSK